MKILKQFGQKQPNILIKLRQLKDQRSFIITMNLFFFPRISSSLAAFIILTPPVLCKVQQPASLLFQNYAIVQRGDTLATIAQRYHSTPEKIIQDNGLR
ncbi:MAG: LysM peptidoglycan-binding domain-containing protein, partial [Alphaproteobacteria bacterium]|nr:LysM peptidoglycan-binding domain-containing protein [Alphaproteobacteria bacterium]